MGRTCSVTDEDGPCSRKHFAKGMCELHWRRKRKWGSADRRPLQSYDSLHNWLRAHRGPARLHVCVQCGAQADEWAYMKNCPSEMVTEDRAFCGVRTHTDCYQAMCRSCHRVMDESVGKRGSSHPGSKLTEGDVVDIRRRAAEGEVLRRLAEEYGVTASNISCIVKRRTWTHV